MPLIDEETLLQGTSPGISRPLSDEEMGAEEAESVGFFEAARAFYKTEDPIFSATKELFAPDVSQEIDPNFKPIDRLEQERPDLLMYADNFVEVFNEEQYQRKVMNIEYELENKEIFSKAPTMTKIGAGLAASTLDPTMLIPYGAIAKTANTVKRVGAGVATGTAGALTAATSREAVLQATQETRTTDETTYNILAETAFGGLLGGGVAALSSPVKSAGQQILAKALRGEDYKIKVNPETMEASVVKDSAGAAAVSDLEAQGLAHINEHLAKVMSGPEALRAPDLRAILSPSSTVNKLGEVFYNSNYIRNKNAAGTPTELNAQSFIFQADQQTSRILKEADAEYLKYAKVGALRAAVSLPEGTISKLEFDNRVWRNLVDSQRVDEIAEVNKVAKQMRTQLDTMAKKLQDAGLLDPNLDPKFMANYMTRIYDLDVLKIPAKRQAFVTKVRDWVKLHNKDGSARINPLEDSEALDIAEDMLEKIRGESSEQVALKSITEGFISKGKFLKERQLLIPDSEISEFLVTDSTRLFNNYMNRANRLLETQKALERAGYNSFADVLNDIELEAAQASRTLSGKAAIKAADKFNKEKELATMMYRSMLGQLREPGKADEIVSTLLNYQFTRLLGGVLLSALSELVMTPFRLGFLNTFRDGWLPLIRDLKTAKLTKDQLNDLSGAIEIEQNSILRAVAGVDDIENIGRSKSKAQQILNAVTDTFATSTGIKHWTSFQRRMAAQVASSDIIRLVTKPSRTKAEIEKLASLGIGSADYDGIARQVNKHVQERNGSFISNLHLWEDNLATQKFKNAVQVQVESTILLPGEESLPFFVQKYPFAKLAFQFKSFSSAATGKIAISSLQRRDANMYMGITMLVVLGAVSGAVKKLVDGKDDEISTEWDDLVLDGLNRSGVLGLVGTTILDSGKNFFDSKSKRYAADNIESVFLGPSAGTISGLTKAIQGLTDGDVTEKDLKAIQRFIPFMNLFYIKAITERLLDEDK